MEFDSRFFEPKPEKTLIDKYLGRQDIESIRTLIKKENLTRQDFRELLYLLSSSEAKLLNFGAYERYIILKFFVWIREFVKVAEQLYDYVEDLETKQKTSITAALEAKDRTRIYDISVRAPNMIELENKVREKMIQAKEDFELSFEGEPEIVYSVILMGTSPEQPSLIAKGKNYEEAYAELYEKNGRKEIDKSRIEIVLFARFVLSSIHEFKLNARTRKLLYNIKRLAEHNIKFLVDLYFNIGRTSLSLDAVGFKELLMSKYEVSYKGAEGDPQVQKPRGLFG